MLSERCSIYVSVSDGEVTEIDAGASLSVCGVAHCEPDIDAVAVYAVDNVVLCIMQKNTPIWGVFFGFEFYCRPLAFVSSFPVRRDVG